MSEAKRTREIIEHAHETAAERDRLKEVNAELVEALKIITTEYVDELCYNGCREYQVEQESEVVDARAAIAKAVT